MKIKSEEQRSHEEVGGTIRCGIVQRGKMIKNYP